MAMRVSKDRIDLDDKVLQKPVLKDYGEAVVTANSSTSYTIDLTEGNVFDITLTDNCSFTFSNPPVSSVAGSFTIVLTQDSTGTRTVTWPDAVYWPDDTEPTLKASPGSVDIVSFLTTDAGTTWYGFNGGSVEEPGPDLSYITTVADAADLTTYTFSSTSIGAAASDRLVIIAIHWEGGQAISSVTIGGTGASETALANSGAGSVAIYQLAVPSGTTADIVVTFASGAPRCGVGVWRMVGQSSNTAIDTDIDTAASGTGLAISLSVVGNSAIVAAQTNGDTVSMTWTGATEDYDSAIDGDTSQQAGGHIQVSEADATYAVSTSHSNSTQAIGLAGAVWF